MYPYELLGCHSDIVVVRKEVVFFRRHSLKYVVVCHDAGNRLERKREKVARCQQFLNLSEGYGVFIELFL